MIKAGIYGRLANLLYGCPRKLGKGNEKPDLGITLELLINRHQSLSPRAIPPYESLERILFCFPSRKAVRGVLQSSTFGIRVSLNRGSNLSSADFQAPGTSSILA